MCTTLVSYVWQFSRPGVVRRLLIGLLYQSTRHASQRRHLRMCSVCEYWTGVSEQCASRQHRYHYSTVARKSKHGSGRTLDRWGWSLIEASSASFLFFLTNVVMILGCKRLGLLKLRYGAPFAGLSSLVGPNYGRWRLLPSQMSQQARGVGRAACLLHDDNIYKVRGMFTPPRTPHPGGARSMIKDEAGSCLQLLIVAMRSSKVPSPRNNQSADRMPLAVMGFIVHAWSYMNEKWLMHHVQCRRGWLFLVTTGPWTLPNGWPKALRCTPPAADVHLHNTRSRQIYGTRRGVVGGPIVQATS